MAKSIGYHSKAIVKVMRKYSNEAEHLFALLLDNISLSTALTDLALIMLVAVLLLLLAVARDSSANGAQSSLSAVLDTLTPVLESWPLASCSFPAAFCSAPPRRRLSLPMRLPTASLVEPTVWSHWPEGRFSLSGATAPVLGSAEKGPSLAVV